MAAAGARRRRSAAALLLLAALGACAFAPEAPPALRRVAVDVTAYAGRLVADLGVPGVCIAVLDVEPGTGTERRWSIGLGSLRGGATEMPADAVHRVASISKLMAATAAMVLVERGQLDLDAPVTRYVPEFAPGNPFGGEVTLRQLLGHRAGLVREPPVGHYFDAGEPTLRATVASLAATALVAAPGSAFKYSNPGFGVVGEAVARVYGKPFPVAVRELVLGPLGLRDSDFEPRAELLARQPHGLMWTYDGRAIPTPQFAFGYGPAADLRSTVGDLVTFARSWFPDAPVRVLSPASQAQMWRLPVGADSGCGLGFFVGDFDGQRMVGHDGAVYGFASAVRALPDAGLAVAVVCTRDFANEVAEAIARRALRAALAARAGAALPPAEFPAPVGVAAARALAGRWRCGREWVQLYERGGELVYEPNIGVTTRLRRAADGALVSHDVLSLGGRRLIERADGRLFDGEEEYVRDETVPPEPPADLLPLLGEYGWDHNVLVVYEDRGELAVLIEWVVRDLPERIAPDHYRFNPGMYTGDQLRFERDGTGAVVAAVVGGARFPRRPDPAPGGFRITPERPVAELLAAAQRQAPPGPSGGGPAPDRRPLRPADLVDLAAVDPTLRFDLKYTTADNFLGTAVYPSGARARLQRPAAEALVRVHRALRERGLGLLVFDAYRPWAVTKAFWEATPRRLRHFVADPMRGSRHNRGCAVDVTLFDLATGAPVAMPSGYDEFTPRAYPDYPGGTTRQRWFRELLRSVMAAEGFTVYEHEWWHFDHSDWQHYGIGTDPSP